MRKVRDDLISENADYPIGSTGITFIFYPKNVCPNWDFSATRIWKRSKITGERTGEQVSWTPVGTDGIRVGPFTDWTVLDVNCNYPAGGRKAVRKSHN